MRHLMLSPVIDGVAHSVRALNRTHFRLIVHIRYIARLYSWKKHLTLISQLQRQCSFVDKNEVENHKIVDLGSVPDLGNASFCFRERHLTHNVSTLHGGSF